MDISTKILTDFKEGRIQGFYNDVYPSLLTYAARCLGSDYGFMAEDCVQESVYKAFCKSADFGTPFQLKSYLYVCVHNYAMSILRKHNSRARYLSERNDTIDDISGSIIYQETLDLLYSALKSLPADLYKVFEMSYEQGMKNAEVAERMGLSESSIKKKKMQLIRLLREQFAKDERMLLLLGMLMWAESINASFV